LFLGAALPLAPSRALANGGGGDTTPSPEERGSIYRINLAIDIPVTAAGAIGTAIPYLGSSVFVDPSCPCDPGHLNLLDRQAVGLHSRTAGKIGDVTVGLAVAAPVVLELLTVRPMTTMVEDLVVYAEVMAVNGGLLALAKFTVQRPTPRAYDGDPGVIDDPGGYLSFYSGHTAYAFASLSFAAVTISFRHRAPVWPWIVTGVAGTGVAAAMILSGAHFPTDVAMGAMAGTTIGVVVPLLHLRRSKRLGLDLVSGPGGRGLALRGRF
jgi:membrane-associated phospholipid phosphatase